MNILIINSSILPYPPAQGGAVENLIDMFVKNNENNKRHKITICTIYDKKAIEFEKKYLFCDFIHIKKNMFFQIKNIFKVLKRKITGKYCANEYLSNVIKKIENNIQEFDLVIVENVPQFGLELRKLSPKKLVLHMHNDNLNVFTKQALEIKNSYDEIWCLSKYVVNMVKEINEDNDKVKLLYNGINVDNYLKQLDDDKVNKYKLKFGIENNDKVIMY